MAAETLEQRVERLENKLHEVEGILMAQAANTASKKRGWRSIVGIDANNPLYDEAVRQGQAWRYADRPASDEGEE